MRIVVPRFLFPLASKKGLIAIGFFGLHYKEVAAEGINSSITREAERI